MSSDDTRALTPFTRDAIASLDEIKRRLPKPMRKPFTEQVGELQARVALGKLGLIATAVVHQQGEEITMTMLAAGGARMVESAKDGTISKEEMEQIMVARSLFISDMVAVTTITTRSIQSVIQTASFKRSMVDPFVKTPRR